MDNLKKNGKESLIKNTSKRVFNKYSEERVNFISNQWNGKNKQIEVQSCRTLCSEWLRSKKWLEQVAGKEEEEVPVGSENFIILW